LTGLSAVVLVLPVADLALTFVSDLVVDALLLAASVVYGALVEATLVLGLVLQVAAVVVTVADVGEVEAHGPVAEAVKLGCVAPQGGTPCKDKENLLTESTTHFAQD
jgi:hypothetical protein